MKALTIYQPHAQMIMDLGKSWEFRHWCPAPGLIGQRIVIHAAQKRLKSTELWDLHGRIVRGLIPGIVSSIALPIIDRALAGNLTYSAALGTAEIGKPIKQNGWDNYGWPMLNVEKWAEPIPCSGLQGLWNWRLQLGRAA